MVLIDILFKCSFLSSATRLLSPFYFIDTDALAHFDWVENNLIGCPFVLFHSVFSSWISAVHLLQSSVYSASSIPSLDILHFVVIPIHTSCVFLSITSSLLFRLLPYVAHGYNWLFLIFIYPSHLCRRAYAFILRIFYSNTLPLCTLTFAKY